MANRMNRNRVHERSSCMKHIEPYVARTIPKSFPLATLSDWIVRDTLAWYRRNPDVDRVPVYEAPPGRHADGLSISIGHAIRRAREEGTMPCINGMHAWDSAVIYPRVTHDAGYREVAVHKRRGAWSFPKPEAYGARLADDLRTEILRKIARRPSFLEFSGLTLFRDKVLTRPDFAGTDDPDVLHAIIARLQNLNLVEVYGAEWQGHIVKALRVTAEGWSVLLPKRVA